MKYSVFKFNHPDKDLVGREFEREVTRQRILWIQQIGDLIGISRVFFASRILDPDTVDDMCDFNKIPFINARQIFITFQNHSFPHKLIRINHPPTWTEIWKICDDAIISIEKQHPRQGSHVLHDLIYDNHGTIIVVGL